MPQKQQTIPPVAGGAAAAQGPLGFPPEACGEAFAAPGMAKPHWASLMAALEAAGPAVLNQRQERIRRMRHEDGAAYNPFDDLGRRGLPWALDAIPMVVDQADWAAVEEGVIQRAALLERILADTYGPQVLLSQGRLPAELIYANPNFLRACSGIRPAGNRFMTFYAADIYRAPDGAWRVLRDFGAAPRGLGYALENRIVISRVFSEEYHKHQIRRLAPFFQSFHDSLVSRNSIRREDTAVALLSPGPECPIFFEHALLSRYLGYPLVEGQDLTVRNGKVFLKKLAGLEPVEAIFRHIGDQGIDPFALRRAGEGVAGLIQAAREGQVDIVSPIGAGFVETPALSVFLPELCRHLLGAELLLPGHPAWWCGLAEHRRHVMAHLAELSLAPAMSPGAAAPVDDPAGAIGAEPWRWLATEPVRPAALPAWGPGGATCRHGLLRVFACATETGFEMMPGALAITADDLETLLGDNPERQQSKDVWVLSDQPVVPFSRMSSLQSVSEFRRGSDLPSRVADHLLWLGRYLERAEAMIRIVRSVYRRLSGEGGPEDTPEVPYLMRLLATQTAIAQPPEGAEAVDHAALPELLGRVLYSAESMESVTAVLGRVREAARTVRDRLSFDSWRVINRLDGFEGTKTDDPLELMDNTLFTLSAFSGLAMEGMTRGLGWRFMDMGRRLERAMNQARLIGTGIPRDQREGLSALEALLEVSDSIMTYRARYRTAFQLAPVLDLLIIDESNPKSIAFQLGRLVAHVDHLPRQSERRFSTAEERLALELMTSVRLLDPATLDQGGESGQYNELAAFLENLEARLGDFGQRISAHYLSRVPTMPHFSVGYGYDRP